MDDACGRSKERRDRHRRSDQARGKVKGALRNNKEDKDELTKDEGARAKDKVKVEAARVKVISQRTCARTANHAVQPGSTNVQLQRQATPQGRGNGWFGGVAMEAFRHDVTR